MAVPTFIWFVEPVLRALASRSGPVTRAELREAAIGELHLSESDRSEMAGSTGVSKARHRTGWAIFIAAKAGLAASPGRGLWQITDEGRQVLKDHPKGIPENVLREIRARSKPAEDSEEGGGTHAPAAEPVDETTPEERLRGAYEQIRARVRGELLVLIRQGTPDFFERLVLRLLHAMGYGSTREDLNQTGGGGDGGIDGIISLDRLGLEKVYIQAKRYADDNVVGRPTIQAFFGALAGRRASKGVFITTSRFSKEAREFAATASDSIVLLDGAELANLMIDFSVGVTPSETFALVEIDSDFFEPD